MVLLRNLILLVVLLAHYVTCEHKQNPVCIYTEGGKICSSAESVKLSQPEDASAVSETHGLGQPTSDNTGSALAPVDGAASVKASNGSINAGTEESNSKHAAPDTHLSNETATNARSQASSDVAAHSSTSVEESSPVVDEVNTNDQDNAAVADASTSIHVDSREAAKENVSKQENSGFPTVTNTTMQGSSVNGEANISAQRSSVEISEANASKQINSVGVVESNTTRQDNSVSVAANAIMDENSPVVDESNASKNAESGLAVEANSSKLGSSMNVGKENLNKQQNTVSVITNVNNSYVGDAEGNALQGIFANSSKSNSSVLSNATAEIQIPEHNVAKNITSKNATEALNRTESVTTAERQENAASPDTGAQTGNNTLSSRKVGSSYISSPEMVAVAEGLVMAGAVLQVATAKPPPAAYLDPAQEVALAEGLEMADAVLQAVKEDEPAVNAVWRATLEADSRMKQDDTPVNEGTLDKGLMAFLVCVMIVLVITGSVSGWVLYTRLRRTPEEDQAQNMYILIDAADPQSNFVDCPLDVIDSEGVSYTFPRVTHDTPY